MSKETYYFKHDYNARADRKLVNVIMKHGMEGVGVYWCIVEMLYEEGGYLPIEYERITFELRSKYEIVKSIVNDFDLFKQDDNKFWSESVIERLDERCEKSEKARESINKRWGKYERITNVLQSNSKRNTKEEKKEEKKREKKKRVFIAPLISEVENYFIENGYTKESGQKAFNSYNVANWIDSKGNPVLNWKQKMINVWFKPENKISQSEILKIKTGAFSR